jgi:septal ring factor EnvC (AmiA/AmiB activator)
MIENDSLLTIVITLLTVLGSAGAWKYYESKLRLKHKITERNTEEHILFREDLRDRILRLEKKIAEKDREKDELQRQIMDLTAQLTEYKVRLEYLEKENKKLRN